MNKILFINNSPIAMEGLRSAFSKYVSEWNVYCASTGEEAIDYLSSVDIDVVVTDIYMPTITGLPILEFVKRKYPSILRLIISPEKSHFHNMQPAQLGHRVYTKSFDSDEIYSFVSNSFQFREKICSSKTQSVLASISHLPKAPTLYTQLILLAKSNHYSHARAAKIIETDVRVNELTLRMVNSPYIGLPNKVKSAALAISILGLDFIKNLVLSIEINDVFSFQNRFPRKLFKSVEYSLLCADFLKEILLYEKVSQKLDDKIIELGYLTGLLHDIGQYILLSTFPKEYNNILVESENAPEKNFWDIENEVLRTTHCEVGAFLLWIWGFDEELSKIVALHHNTLKLNKWQSLIVSALYCADICAKEIVYGNNNFLNTECVPFSQAQDFAITKFPEWQNICHKNAIEKDLKLAVNSI